MLGLQGFDASVTPDQRRRVVLVLAAAVVAISSSAVLVRAMEGIDAVAIAAWRTLGATVRNTRAPAGYLENQVSTIINALS